MAHIHEVLDSNLHFVIDPVTRVLRIDTEDPDKSGMTVIQYDHNSERVTFEIPRIVDGHDMATCNVVEVHYLNVSKDGRTQASGAYVVEDLGVKADDENTVVGTWLISGNATQIAGTLNFLVRFVCISENAPDYVWNSAVYQSIAVSSGLYSGEEIVTEYPDVIAQWEARITELEKSGVSDDRIKEVFEEYLEENPVGDLFVAVYDDTTTAEIYGAYQAGKSVVCSYRELYTLALVTCTEDFAIFGGVTSNGMISITCSENAWSVSTRHAATTITETSDDKHFATAKAVYDFVRNNGGAVTDEQIATAVAAYLAQNPVSGVPVGGKAGQYLRKQSDADGDVVWSDLEIPEQYGLVTYDQDKTITIT